MSNVWHCEVYANVVSSGGTAMFQVTGEHDCGTDGVGYIHDEDHGGCSTRVNVIGVAWRIHLVFSQHIPKGFVFFFSCLVGEVSPARFLVSLHRA